MSEHEKHILHSPPETVQEMYNEIREDLERYDKYQLTPSEATFLRFIIRECIENNIHVTSHMDWINPKQEALHRLLLDRYGIDLHEQLNESGQGRYDDLEMWKKLLQLVKEKYRPESEHI